MKATGTTLWYSPNIGATNESKFTALPAGVYSPLVGGMFSNLKYSTTFWSSSQPYGQLSGGNHSLTTGEEYIRSDGFSISHGYSVRCVKD